MTSAEFTTLAPPGNAILDDAHVGDIHGAFGTIRRHDVAPRRTFRRRLLTLLAIMGPGLIVMVGDNDAGGVATYAQAGQNYGTTLLWTLLLLVPVLIVNQEMVVRLGAVTGVGHARLIIERFGKLWGAFSVGDLFILNFLTIVTEFIGISLAASYLGVSPDVAVPLAAGGLVAMTVTGSFRRWERCMYLFIALSFLMIPLALLAHPKGGQVLHDALVPGIEGGMTSDAVLLIVAIVGTTVAPWQLFFQQSNVVDKRITPRWISFERWDTAIGAVITNVGAAALIVAAAFAFRGTTLHGQFTDAGGVATGLDQTVGHVAGTIFVVILIEAAIIGAAAVTLSTSYAFGDVFGTKHSLHRRLGDAKGFYASFTLLVGAAAGIVLIPGAPLGLITVGVQALAGVLLPSATVFLLLLCNDRAVLGPWVNAPWLNGVASAIVGTLLMLSGILVVTTLFPGVNVGVLLPVLSGALALGLVAIAGYTPHDRRRRAAFADAIDAAVTNAGPALRPGGPVVFGERASRRSRERHAWRMPPLAALERPVWSRGRRVGMWALRGYLVVSALLLVVKAAQIASAH